MKERSSFQSRAHGGGVPGMRPTPLGPNSFIFMQFSAKILQNNGLAQSPWELASPLRNPGSATLGWVQSSNCACGGRK